MAGAALATIVYYIFVNEDVQMREHGLAARHALASVDASDSVPLAGRDSLDPESQTLFGVGKVDGADE